ncbi:IclR family transcriptional regulator [Paenibacillus sp. YN15]|uniref:IclR family transcriptional regulator n=1 Tax=Paenibacillus sp. YN15 TaxID=1742774 RepID=UPI000DCEB35F|nr:IclR family transcriptional regulator [Paenibacillus sp. YN15]RAV04144.1 IclR family transcriptional regulator [Paenibacillus sp. YN15]
MSVKSAERSLRIFELLAGHPEGLTVQEIARLLSYPQSSTLGLVRTLHEEGYLHQFGSKQYKLGPRLIQLGFMAMEALDVAALGKPHLAALMEVTQETVFMSVLSQGQLVYVAKMDSNRSIRTAAQPGARRPLYCTGLGKAFLAFMPEEERQALLAEMSLIPLTGHTITSRERLEEELRGFRELGYAVDNEESEEGLYCLAAPVRGAGGQLQAAVSVAGPKERMASRQGQIATELLKAVDAISRSLGYWG